MVVGGGGGRGGGLRGRTLRERAGGALGGLVGVAGALTGQHRSLGGLTQSAISGGAQGRALGEALGRKFVGRRGQARADLREAEKQAAAQRDAKMMEATRSRGQGMGSKFNPVAAVRRRNFAVSQEEDERLRRANQANQAVAVTMAAQDKENQRMGRAFRQGMYQSQGKEFGENERRYADIGRQAEEMMPNIVTGMETMRRINVPQEDSVDQRMQEMAQLSPQQKLLPASDPKLTAAGELGQQVRPEDVDADTEGEVSDNEYPAPPTPQGDPSELTEEQKKILVQSLRQRKKE